VRQSQDAHDLTLSLPALCMLGIPTSAHRPISLTSSAVSEALLSVQSTMRIPTIWPGQGYPGLNNCAGSVPCHKASCFEIPLQLPEYGLNALIIKLLGYMHMVRALYAGKEHPISTHERTQTHIAS
jgi:hypothetical protein